MYYPNETQTQEDILKRSLAQLDYQERVNQATEVRYDKLSYFEREEMMKWLKSNLSQIPLLSKTKKVGLEKLVSGDYRCPSALALIRYALKALSL